MKKSGKRLLSLALTLALVLSGSNVYEAQAASSKVYTNDFEKSAGTFKGFGGADVMLSNKADEVAANTSEADFNKYLAANVTDGTAAFQYYKEWDSSQVNVDVAKFMSVTSKDEIMKSKYILITMNVDKAVAFTPERTPKAKCFFQGNATWTWAVGPEIAVTAGKDFVAYIPTADIKWGSGDTKVGGCGVQLFDFKDGDTIYYTVKSVTLSNDAPAAAATTATTTDAKATTAPTATPAATATTAPTATPAATAAPVANATTKVTDGTASVAYVKQYDVANANISLKDFIPAKTKEEISKASAIEIVMSVDKADKFVDDKAPSATVYFMGNATWQWVVGPEVAVKANEDFTVTLPTSAIKWGSGDTSVGDFGVQIFNFKEGTVFYTVKSVKLVKGDSTSTTTTTPATEPTVAPAEPTVAPTEAPVEEEVPAIQIGKAKSGKNFLFVTDRWDTNSGAKVDLTKTLKAGSTYKVTAYVKNIGTDEDTFQLYFGKDAKTKGKAVAKVKGSYGKWVKLEATITVPKTAKKAILSFDSVNTSNDFGIDNITIKKTK